jgi:type VI secretion system secreted protein VgrG
MIDIFTVSSSVLPEGTRVIGFRGSEGISRPYVFEIYLSIESGESHEIDLADAVGAKATLTLARQGDDAPYLFHGLFSELSLLHEMGGRAVCRALLVPQLWRLRQTFHSRIFTAMSIPDVIAATLEDGGLTSDDYVFKLAGQYKPEEHVCQYQESHFDFISRWMEREGLYYYFEQGDSGEKLVITDSASFQDDLVAAPVRFFALAGGDVTARACLQSFTCRHRALPGSVRFKDYDYTKPTLGITGTAPVSRVGLGEINIHGGRFFTPEAGKRLATLRAEELLAREVVFTGSGTTFHLRPGYTFTLEDHPRASFDAKYLATEVEHTGNQAATTAELRKLTGLDGEEVYRVDVTAIPKAVQFRAELKTPWPRVYGTEHGIIDGDIDSEYAQIDDHGRYLVRFAFDESDLNDGKASTRVRMMQPHGGGIEGWHFPLRKGTEVLFTFLGGDPDRPVIAGVVPNAHTPSPVTKANHTRNVIQTGGRNRLELEDKAGSERITMQTPHTNTMIRMGSANEEHNMILRTDGATLLDAGQDWDVTVGGKLDEDITGAVIETYHANQDTSIAKGRKEVIAAGGLNQNIHGGLFQTIAPDGYQTVNGPHTQRVTALNSDDYGSWRSAVKTTWDATIGGNITITSSGGTVTITSPTEITLNAPKVSNKATTEHYKETGILFELYGTKNSLGIHKWDNTALSMAATGVKTELTGMAFANTGVKMEKCALGVSNVGLKIDSGLFRKSTAATEITTNEILLKTGAFASLAKAFMKIG